MRTPRSARRALGALLTVAALFVLAACGSDQDPAVGGSTSTTGDATSTTEPDGDSTSSTTATTAAADGATVIEIDVTGGAPDGGARTETVDLGDEVELRVTADAEDEVHVHGYDLELPLRPGETATLRFTADLPGRWEIELHDAKVELLQLEVRG